MSFPERKKKIETNISREINLNLKEIERLKKEEEKLGIPREELVKRWREINQKLKDKDIWQQKLSKVRLEYEESKQAAKLIVGLQGEIKEIEKIIKEKKYALIGLYPLLTGLTGLLFSLFFGKYLHNCPTIP